MGYGFAAGSTSVSNSRINSNFKSVTEQTGIKAGDGGFAVDVRGNTDLTGGVIASTDAAVVAGRNSFATSGLTMRDIENRAEYDAKGVGVNVGKGWSPSGELVPQGTGAGIGEDSGSAASVTRSGISGIAGNTDVRANDAETGIKPIFDAEKVQKEIDAQVAITQKFNEIAPKAAADYTKSKVADLKRQAELETEPDKKGSSGKCVPDCGMSGEVTWHERCCLVTKPDNKRSLSHVTNTFIPCFWHQGRHLSQHPTSWQCAHLLC